MKRKQLTQGQLAQQLGINVRYVRRLAREGMPTDSVAAARAWRDRNIAGPVDGGDINKLRGVVLSKRAELLQLELDERRGELVKTSEAQRLMVAGGVYARTRLENADRELRAQFPDLPATVHAAIRKLHDEALRLISQDILAAGEAE